MAQLAEQRASDRTATTEAELDGPDELEARLRLNLALVHLQEARFEAGRVQAAKAAPSSCGKGRTRLVRRMHG